MDINGIVAIKIVKGGVKAPDFFSYVAQIVAKECPLFSKRKIVLMMDNAKIHHSKDCMVKFQKYTNVVYNSKSEIELIKNILNVGKTFIRERCLA